MKDTIDFRSLCSSSMRGVAVACALLAGAQALPKPASADPLAERFFVANRFRSLDTETWRGLRLGFIAGTDAPSLPVRVAVYAVAGGMPFDCQPFAPGELSLLAEREIVVGEHPVVPKRSLWIGMPPKDEVWITWTFDDPIELPPEQIVLVTVDGDAQEALATGSVIDYRYVLDMAKASLLSLDDGATYECLDEQTALTALGIDAEIKTPSLMRVEAVPVR